MSKHPLETAPRVNAIVQGITVQAPHVFPEGHALTADEAGFLNRALVNRVGSSLGNKWKKTADAAYDALSAEEKAAETKEAHLTRHVSTLNHQALFDAAFAEFDLSAVRGAGEAARSPLEQRSRDIAESILKELPNIKAAGVRKLMLAKRPDGETQWSFLIGQLLSRRADIVEMAKSQLEAEAALKGGKAEENYDDLLNDVDLSAPAAQHEPTGEEHADHKGKK